MSIRPQFKSKSTAIFVETLGFSLANSRTLLLEHLVNNGWRVIIATKPDEYAHSVTQLGVELFPILFARGGLSIRNDLNTVHQLRNLYRREKPAFVHHFNPKPILLGTVAATGLNRISVFNTITGLGHAFASPGPSKILASLGYRLCLKRSRQVVFQNSDDLSLFEQNGWVTGEQARLIVSSGVDTNRFRPRDQWSGQSEQSYSPLRVLMIGRLIWQKGIREYVEAARILKAQFPHVRFQLAGDWYAGHPDAVPPEYIEQAQAEGVLEFLGYLTNLEQVLPNVDLMVLPSYREGAPRVLLEAGACGVPMITTDAPGCREVVTPGKTGELVPVGNHQALSDAMAGLLEDADRRSLMGRQARELMVRQFDRHVITQQYLDMYSQNGIDIGSKHTLGSATPLQRSA